MFLVLCYSYFSLVEIKCFIKFRIFFLIKKVFISCLVCVCKQLSKGEKQPGCETLGDLREV